MFNNLLSKAVVLKGPDQQYYTAKVPRFPSLNGTQPVMVTPVGEPKEGWTDSKGLVILNAVNSDKSLAERTLNIIG